MRNAVTTIVLLLVVCRTVMALTPDGRQAYEATVVRAMDGIETLNMDDGSKLYHSNGSAHAFMRQWDAVIASPPPEVRGTRNSKAWDADPLGKQAGFDEAYEAKYLTADNTPYSVTVLVKNSVAGSWLTVVWEEPKPGTPAPKPTAGPTLQQPLPSLEVREQTTAVRPDTTYCVAFSPDSKSLAAGGAGGEITLMDSTTGERLGGWQAHRKPAYSDKPHLSATTTVAYAPDGSRLISTSLGGEIKVWNAAGTPVSQAFLDGDDPRISHGVLTPDGKTLAVAGWNLADWSGEYDPLTGRSVRRFIEKTINVALDKAGHRIAFLTLEEQPRLVVFNESNAEQLCAFSVPEVGIGAGLCFSPDGNLVVALLQGGVLVACDVTARKLLYTMTPAGKPIKQIAFTADGRFMLAGLENGGMTALDPRTGLGLCQMATSQFFMPMVLSPDGTRVTCGHSIVTGANAGLSSALAKLAPPKAP